jgi:hypothetical protein
VLLHAGVNDTPTCGTLHGDDASSGRSAFEMRITRRMFQTAALWKTREMSPNSPKAVQNLAACLISTKELCVAISK